MDLGFQGLGASGLSALGFCDLGPADCKVERDGAKGFRSLELCASRLQRIRARGRLDL